MPWRPNVEKVMSIIDKQCMVGRDIMQIVYFENKFVWTKVGSRKLEKVR